MKNSSTLTSNHIYFIATLFVAIFFLNSPSANAQNRQLTKQAKKQEKLLLKYDSVFIANHSAVKATMFSAVLPGLGQIYNKKSWKVPIIYSLIAGNIYFNRWSSNYYKIYRIGYADATIEILNEDLREIPGVETYLERNGYTALSTVLKDRYDYYQKLMHISIITFGAIYMLNILDANIDAEFLEYDVSKDLTIKVKPSIFQNDFTQKSQLGLTCSLRF
jgi:hypothetical protein